MVQETDPVTAPPTTESRRLKRSRSDGKGNHADVGSAHKDWI